jgi:hypothetical protein
MMQQAARQILHSFVLLDLDPITISNHERESKAGIRQSGLRKSKAKFDSGDFIGEVGVSTARVNTGSECKIDQTRGASSKVEGDVGNKFTSSVTETEEAGGRLGFG